MEDQSKFFNVIIDKTNQKLNSFQAQIIVLESQLQMANDERDEYKKYVEGIPSLNFNITELENTKKKYEQCQIDLNNSLEEISTYKLLVESLEYNNNEKLRIIDEKYAEQVKTLQDKNAELELKVNSGSTYLKDQNETLLQEIRRLNAELSASRSR
jgi:septal ring factor EnvC (AmiA/AmiB activator)